MGYASCVALVLFVIVLSLTLVQRRLIERRVHYY
jgi:ABC-type sugar transport system permease subunit